MKTRTIVLTTLVVVCAVTRLPAQTGQHRDHDRAHLPHLEHRFDDPERLARSFDDPSRDEWQLPARVLEVLDVQPGQRVADIGAGTGYFTIKLARSTDARVVYAVDVEPSMVEYLRERADGEGLQNVITVLAEADQTNLPQPVDVVLIVNTYHHLPDRGAYFSALRSLMTPSARLAIIDYRKDAPSGPPVEFRFTPEEIGHELAQAGFDLRAVHDFLPRQHFLVFEAR